VLKDIFIRADKNDNGIVCLSEFQSVFDDSLMGSVPNLFKEMKAKSASEVTLAEFLAFFSGKSVPCEKFYAVIDSGHRALRPLLTQISTEYKTEDSYGQFKTRFFLDQSLLQIRNLQDDIEATLGPMEALVPSRVQNTSQKTMKLDSPHATQDFSEVAGALPALRSHIARLESEVGVPFLCRAQNTGQPTGAVDLSVVCRRVLTILPGSVSVFQDCINRYLSGLKQQKGHIHSECEQDLRPKTSALTFHIYEIWIDQAALSGHYRSSYYRAHQHSLIDFLDGPEKVSTITAPAEWFSHTSI